MRSGHTTTAVPRPRSGHPRPLRSPQPAVTDPGREAALDHSRTARSGDDGHRIVQRRPHRWVLGVFGLGVVVALGASLFVLPVQAWLRQDEQLRVKEQELSVLTEANRKIGAEVRHLGTPQGAKEAARDELGVVSPGEQRMSMLPDDVGLLPLPTGWPYDVITQIVNVRQTGPSPTPIP